MTTRTPIAPAAMSAQRSASAQGAEPRGAHPGGDAWRRGFYDCWMEMGGGPPRGPMSGGSFIRDPDLKVEEGEKACAGLRMKLNDVGDANGEPALWIDGTLAGHFGRGFGDGGEPFEGSRRRDPEALKTSSLWTLFCVTQSPEGPVSKVWFDRLVAARDYVGPLVPAAGGKRGR